MQTDEKEKIIIEHVLGKKKKENLEMALDIISTPIREQIIKTFLDKLKGFICKKHDMSQWVWEKDLYHKPYGGREYRSFGVYRKFGVLQEPIRISLLCNTKGNELYIVVFSPSNNKSFNKSLGQKLNDELKPETSWGEDWKGIWSQSLKSSNWDYADWTNKDTLIKMHTETDRVVEDIGNNLLRIIEVAKPVIEEWVEQNPSAP